MEIQKKILYFLISINLISFLVGFFFMEDHGGASLDSVIHTYPAIEGIRENFLKNILTYGKYGENSYPLHHIIFAFINPFEVGTFYFKLISLIWSSLSIIFFYLIIYQRFNFKLHQVLFLASLLLLSPYFRSSAFWGMTENTGLLFLMLSIYFYNNFKINNSNNNIFFVCLFSSLSLYSRIQNIFICLFYFIDIFIRSSNKKKIFLISSFAILAVPCVILIYIWGGIIDEQHAGELNHLINFSTIPRTLLVIFSLIGFYSLPFLICLVSDYQKLIKKNLIKYFLILLIFVFIFYFNEIDILSLNVNRDFVYGQGFVANIFYKVTNIQSSYLILSALGFQTLLYLFQYSLKNKLLIISFLLFFSLRVHLFSEYLDPLLFVLVFGILDFKQINQIFVNFKNIFVLEAFFIFTLFGAILI